MPGRVFCHMPSAYVKPSTPVEYWRILSSPSTSLKKASRCRALFTAVLRTLYLRAMTTDAV